MAHAPASAAGGGGDGLASGGACGAAAPPGRASRLPPLSLLATISSECEVDSQRSRSSASLSGRASDICRGSAASAAGVCQPPSAAQLAASMRESGACSASMRDEGEGSLHGGSARLSGVADRLSTFDRARRASETLESIKSGVTPRPAYPSPLAEIVRTKPRTARVRFRSRLESVFMMSRWRSGSVAAGAPARSLGASFGAEPRACSVGAPDGGEAASAREGSSLSAFSTAPRQINMTALNLARSQSAVAQEAEAAAADGEPPRVLVHVEELAI